MSDLLVTLVSLAWLVTAGGQAPAPKPSEAPQLAQGAAHQRSHAGDRAKVATPASSRKVTASQNASDTAGVTAQGVQQRDYAREANGSKPAPRPPS